MRILAFLAGCILCSLNPALADDSSAALSAGGVVFTKAPNIRMASEDLYISPDVVRIRYEFVNDSDREIETLVAFPLPDIDTWNFYEVPLGRTTGDPVNFVDFSARADGKSVPVKVEQRAIYEGRDVTGLLRAAGVPVNVIVNEGFKTLNALPDAKKKVLEKAGIAERDAPDQEHPKWTVRTRFYWMQHFSPHKTVVLEHSYKPVTAQAFFSEIAANLKPGSPDEYWKKTYCMDEGTVVALKAKLAARKSANSNDGMLNAYSTDFILKTANNWSGGIGRFHLIIDKLKPGNVLSLCWDNGLKKTGPTRFTFTRENFRPSRDLAFAVFE